MYFSSCTNTSALRKTWPKCYKTAFDKTTLQDKISAEDMTTFHGEDGIDEFAGGGEWDMDRSRSMKRSAIVQIGNAQQVWNSDTL